MPLCSQTVDSFDKGAQVERDDNNITRFFPSEISLREKLIYNLLKILDQESI